MQGSNRCRAVTDVGKLQMWGSNRCKAVTDAGQ